MTPPVNRVPVQKVFESFGHQIGFEAFRSLLCLRAEHLPYINFISAGFFCPYSFYQVCIDYLTFTVIIRFQVSKQENQLHLGISVDGVCTNK